MRVIPTRPSTNIAVVEYDDNTRRLQVTFQSGSTYEAAGVPKEVADGFAETPSPGGYYNRWIKDRYPVVPV